MASLQIDDRRPEPRPVRVTVSMWRAPEVVHGNHVARYEFVQTADTPLVVQRFQEGDCHCASAVAARIVGDRAEVHSTGETARTVTAPARAGKKTALVSSAASWAPGADVGQTALELLDRAGRRESVPLRIPASGRGASGRNSLKAAPSGP